MLIAQMMGRSEAETGRRIPFWMQRITDAGSWRWKDPYLGANLAALRKGAGREPGTVPALWEFHAEDPWPPGVPDGGPLSARFVAEHHALVLFGFHQQSRDDPVHRRDASLGMALKRLHTSRRFGKEAVDRRFLSAIVADEVDHVAYHLRGLIMQLRSLGSVPPIDYSRLVDDLAAWASPARRDRMRRRWGLDYHAFERDGEHDAAPTGRD